MARKQGLIPVQVFLPPEEAAMLEFVSEQLERPKTWVARRLIERGLDKVIDYSDPDAWLLDSSAVDEFWLR